MMGGSHTSDCVQAATFIYNILSFFPFFFRCFFHSFSSIFLFSPATRLLNIFPGLIAAKRSWLTFPSPLVGFRLRQMEKKNNNYNGDKNA